MIWQDSSNQGNDENCSHTFLFLRLSKISWKVTEWAKQQQAKAMKRHILQFGLGKRGNKF